ncbi:hypothetical protein ScPMuIL_012993 [Solemya velum]
MHRSVLKSLYILFLFYNYGLHCKKIISETNIYTNDFAVAIDGTEDDAKRVAEKDGFIYIRKIVSNYYLFRKTSVSKMSSNEDLDDVWKLREKSEVIDVRQQIGRRRVLKKMEDSQWEKMWFLNGAVTPTTGVLRAWEKGYNGSGIHIAVVDDGIDQSHPDLSENMLTSMSYDYVDGDDDVSPQKAPEHGSHGTICAGLIAAVKSNGNCIAGIAHKAKFAGIRIIGGEDNDAITDATEAIALGHRKETIDIYSNSWGVPDGAFFKGPDHLAQLALIDGVEKGRNGLGAIYVFAAGNGGLEDNCNGDGYVNSIYTIAITGISTDGSPVEYNEHCAPAMAAVYSGDTGVTEQKIVSTDFGGTCTTGWVGTSFATPQASAMIALALQANPLLTWRDVQHLIVHTAQVPQGRSGWKTNGAGYRVSDRLGFGLMDADAMVTRAVNWKTVPEQKVCTMPKKYREIYIEARTHAILPYTMNCSQTRYLEHVLLKVDYSTLSRGEISITLTSPSGTKSKMLTSRELENDWEVRWNWTYMSVQFWGENPNGVWKMDVYQGGSYMDGIYRKTKGLLNAWQLVFHGTTTLQELPPGKPTPDFTEMPPTRTPYPKLTTKPSRGATDRHPTRTPYPRLTTWPSRGSTYRLSTRTPYPRFTTRPSRGSTDRSSTRTPYPRWTTRPSRGSTQRTTTSSRGLTDKSTFSLYIYGPVLGVLGFIIVVIVITIQIRRNRRLPKAGNSRGLPTVTGSTAMNTQTQLHTGVPHRVGNTNPTYASNQTRMMGVVNEGFAS